VDVSRRAAGVFRLQFVVRRVIFEEVDAAQSPIFALCTDCSWRVLVIIFCIGNMRDKAFGRFGCFGLLYHAEKRKEARHTRAHLYPPVCRPTPHRNAAYGIYNGNEGQQSTIEKNQRLFIVLIASTPLP
jgi:hypothetical protein